MNDTLLTLILGGLLAGIPAIVVAILTSASARKRAFDDNSFSAAMMVWERKLEFARELRKEGVSVELGAVWKDMVFLNLIMHKLRSGDLKNEEKAKEAIEEVNRIFEAITEAAVFKD